jgi:hypothetical protein
MSPPSLLSALALLLLPAGLPACSPEPKTPETPETPASTSEADAPKDLAPSSPDGADRGKGEAGPAQGSPRTNVDKNLSLDTYEMTPSDCDALGRHYGEVGRSDQMAALSPKLSDKQRSATADQIDKVVGKIEATWINVCQTSLVNKAVDHDGINCALAARTVKAFDVCLNGTATTTVDQGSKPPPGKGKK